MNDRFRAPLHPVFDSVLAFALSLGPNLHLRTARFLSVQKLALISSSPACLSVPVRSYTCTAVAMNLLAPDYYHHLANGFVSFSNHANASRSSCNFGDSLVLTSSLYSFSQSSSSDDNRRASTRLVEMGTCDQHQEERARRVSDSRKRSRH